MRLSRDPAARRRLSALGGGAAAAAVAGVVVGAGAGSGESPERAEQHQGRPAAAAGLTLAQQVGQTTLLSFDGNSPPAYVRAALQEGHVAGVILFGGNVVSQEQLRSLTRQLQLAAGDAALVATDQEGGSIRIIRFAAPRTGQAVQSTPGAAAAAAGAAARDLRSLGVNVNLAPVADVATFPGSFAAGRAYPGDSRAVAALVRAAVEAYRAGRVASTVKHFPGLGPARENTDDAAVTIDLPRPELDPGLEPFRAAIGAGAPLVMVSHALYPALDGREIVSQSPLAIGELLRRQLGFRGVVVTDSLEAEAVTRRSSIEAAAARSVEAGVDLVLMTGTASWADVHRSLLRRAERSRAFRQRVREAAERVLALKRSLGLRSPRPGR